MILALLLAIARACVAQPAAKPELILLNAGSLDKARGRLTAHDSVLQPALERLLRDAASALKAPPTSVMDKQKLPPSGDKHDYMSYGPYWWPDAKKKNGLPYVRRDGEVNPEVQNGAASDFPRMGRMANSVETLALAFHFTGEEHYAAHAARLLRTWFLDPATRMKPNLDFGQAIPGISVGRGIGIIDSICLLRIPDATILLSTSLSWTAPDQQGLREWFASYLDWLRTSKNGGEEAATKNNHGTFFDAQVAAFALYTGKPEIARQILETAKAKRVAHQIQPDGRQPEELARTNSFSYSCMNLDGLLTLGVLGRHVGVDLLHYATPDGRSIRRALDYLLQYSDPARPWPNQQINRYRPTDLHETVLRAAVLFEDDGLRKLAERLNGPQQQQDRLHLLLNH